MAILNEPTAAALTFAAEHGEETKEERKCLIFDFGGGTFDVTVLVV